MPPQNELKRQLGLPSTTAIIIGMVIGLGIFIYPAGMAKSLGSPMWLLIIWAVMGLMSLCGALCYGELATRFPETGGTYIYLREAYGSRIAFLYGWMAFLVLDPGLTATFGVGLASYASFIVKLSPLEMKVLAIGTILVLAIVNIIGVRLTARLMQVLMVLKIGFLLFIVIWGFGSGMGDWGNFVPFTAQRPGSDALLSALAGGTIAGFFSFAGWWDLTKLTGEARDPGRTLPRALILGILVITAVYILTSAVFLYLVPLASVPAGEASGQTFAAQAGVALFGQVGGQIFSGIVIICAIGSLTAYLMAAPRVYYAMALDGVFIKQIASIHQRFGTPARAIALQALLSSFLVAIGTFEEIIAYFFFVTVIFIAMTVASTYIFRRRAKDAIPYRMPGYPLTPLFFLIIVALLLFLLAMGRTRQAFLGVGVVALGLPVYELLFRKRTVND
jgi:APA family basic amino acid/polyamine antiporter